MKINVFLVCFIIVVVMFSMLTCDNQNPPSNDNNVVSWIAIENIPMSSIRNIVWCNDKWFALGVVPFGSNVSSRTILANSTDGVNWTSVISSNYQGLGYSSIAYGNNLYVKIGSSNSYGYIWYSSDGVNWTITPEKYYEEKSDLPYDIIYDNEKFIVVGSGNKSKIIYSYDGINWINVINNTFPHVIYGITQNGNKYVVVGNRGYKAYSEDGINWITENNETPENFYYSFNDIAYGNGIFIAVGDVGRIEYSLDGVFWTVADSIYNNGSLYSITFGNNIFVTVGNSGRIAYSTNGIKWSAIINSTFERDMRSVIWGDDKFIATDGINMAYWDGVLNN